LGFSGYQTLLHPGKETAEKGSREPVDELDLPFSALKLDRVVVWLSVINVLFQPPRKRGGGKRGRMLPICAW
jgi:hypothetical protein